MTNHVRDGAGVELAGGDVSGTHELRDEGRRRGRDAEAPTEIPARGWKDVLVRVKDEAKADNVPLLAAGVAFYGLLALVPALVAMLSIYGLVSEAADIQRQVTDVLAAAPAEVRDMIVQQLSAIQDSSAGTALLAAVVGIVVALWSASSGMKHVVEAVNAAYDEDETRGFLKVRALSLGMTVGAILFLVVAFGAIAFLPAIADAAGLGTVGRIAVSVLRWVALLVGMTCGLAVLYRYAPDRDNPKWTWASPGALLATLLWLAGSLLFSLYTANFGKYNETYGSLGAVVVVMLWLDLTALAVILGAELNAELERQTVRDTTEGQPESLGRRGAYAADTVGPAADS